MVAGDLCTRDVVLAGRDESIVVAARRMRDRHVGNLVVVDDVEGRHVPVGVLTDRDIVLTVVAQGADRVEQARVGEVMSSDVLVARFDDPVEDVLARMTAGGVRRVPLVDASGGLYGVLAIDDLMGLLSEELSDVVRLIVRARGREASHFPPRFTP